MRIVTGGISHETSTFAKTPTTVHDFETGMGMFRGDAVIERFRGTNICTGGFIDGAARHGFELVPLLWCFAYPSGLIPRADYDSLKGEFLERLAQAKQSGPVDGVLLDLHGAMVVEGIDDGDGDFIESVRNAVGPECPIVVTFDLHGNHTARRVAAATAIIGFDTYPHVDMAERGREAADLIVRTIRGEIRPVMAFRQMPFFWSAAMQVTAHPPIDEAFRLIHDAERQPGILSITLATGFPWADVPDMGPSVIVVADGDTALAERTANELGDWVWSRRERWFREPPSVREALAAGEREGRYPIMLADMADNTGGGASGDSTEVLRTFLNLNLRDALVLYLVDPEVAQQAHAAGVGGRIAVRLGGKSDPIQGPPVDCEAEVVAVSDGRFTYDGPMYAGLTGDLGTSAWLRIGGVNVVVVSGRMQPLDQAFARSLGIDCSTMKYIAVKSAVHFRSGFERLGGSIHNINARAIHTHDFRQLNYKRRRRPIWPVETD
ncbi:MAG: M81 family metallopeptidase [Planctomycetales bacterium]|nr:M81 family metallopeptidase [Planctomycetales bacterium]